MHHRENFILVTFQFSAGKAARRWLGFSCLHVVSQEIGQLVLRDFQSPGTATQQGLERTSGRLGISCTAPTPRRLQPGPGLCSWTDGDGAHGGTAAPAALGAPQHSAPQPACPWESSHSRADTTNVTCTLQRLSGNPGTQQKSPSSSLQGEVVGACAAAAQAETTPLFGGAGGAKVPGKASPGVCLSPAEPRWCQAPLEVPRLCPVKGRVRSPGISNLFVLHRSSNRGRKKRPMTNEVLWNL